jgi:transcriptional regulator with XRE-family HTH domain
MKFKRIKDLREDNDKFQKDIAQLLGISQQYYSEYEKGNRTIPINHLITLAKYYNTSIDYIVGLSDESNLKKNNIKR